MLRHVATAAMRRLATPGGSGVRAFAGHNARWRAAFSSEGEGQDGESAADASTSESSVQDSAAEGADAAVDAFSLWLPKLTLQLMTKTACPSCAQ